MDTLPVVVAGAVVVGAAVVVTAAVVVASSTGSSNLLAVKAPTDTRTKTGSSLIFRNCDYNF